MNISALLFGLWDLPWWGYTIFTLATTHITIASVTIFLHRHQAHGALDLHPIASHFFRFWLWLTTGMKTKEWVAVHRKHHAKVETREDPHSPHIYGIGEVLFKGTELYRNGASDENIVRVYGKGTPDDHLERHLYTRHSGWGVRILLLIDLVLFGIYGIAIWGVQMIWIPFFAAGVINGVGHWAKNGRFWCYRNFETPDCSCNIVPWGILIGGEELHNNHHDAPWSAKLSRKPWEFDAGWLYIRLLQKCGLAKVWRITT